MRILLAAFCLIAALKAPATEPFAAVPSSADFVLRVDISRMESTPRYSGVLADARADNPRLLWAQLARWRGWSRSMQESFLAMPGEPSAVDAWLLEPPGFNLQMGPRLERDARGGFCLHGAWNIEAVRQNLRELGFMPLEPVEDYEIFAASDGTGLWAVREGGPLLAAPRLDNLKDSIGALASPEKRLAAGDMAPALQSVAGQPAGGVLRIPQPVKEALAAAAADPTPTLQTIPGGVDAARALTAADRAAFAITPDNLRITFAFPTQAQSRQASTQLTQCLQATALLAQLGALNDAALSRAIQPLTSAEFVMNGETTTLEVAISDEAVERARKLLFDGDDDDE